MVLEKVVGKDEIRVNIDLKDEKDVTGFMWNILIDELVKQPDRNLVEFRRLINKVLKDRRREAGNVD